MNKYISALALLVGTVSSFASVQTAETAVNTAHVRNYSFSFNNGNLLPNFSFEDGFYAWEGNRLSRHDDILKLDSIVPITGSYVGLADLVNALSSDFVPVEEKESYTLSLYEINNNKIDYSPKVCFYSSKNDLLNCAQLAPYAKSKKWSFYKSTFETPSKARLLKVSLAEYPNGIFYFDDVVLEKGKKASNRGGIGMRVVYSDALGRGYSSQKLVRKETLNELLPGACVNKHVVYGTNAVDIGARSVVLGGNIGGGVDVTIDNDVLLKDESLFDFTIRAQKTVHLGDRDSVYGKLVYGESLQLRNQDYVQQQEQLLGEETCEIEVPGYDAGTEDVYVGNDQELSLAPGAYKDLMVRARSVLHLTSGEYYFDRFTLEPTAKLDFDLSQGNVVLHVKSNLWLNDNTAFIYDSTSTNFIAWFLDQESSMRLGTISNLAGVFVAPRARIELGHQSVLRGTIYAKEVFLMQDSRIVAPSFLFGESKNIYAVSENRYDNHGRIVQQDKPYIVELDSEGYVLESAKNANNYYSLSGDGPDAGGYAYSATEYSLKDGHVVKQSVPGIEWNLNSTHIGKKDQVFVPSLDIPSQIGVFSINNDNAPYVLSFSEDVEGIVSLSWKNRLGQLVQTAEVVEKNGSNMKNWRWAIKRYEYTREGSLRRTLTPLDYNSADSAFAIISEYDVSGREISKESPDVGKQTFHYDLVGNLVFSVTAEQRTRNAFTYKEYDSQGRIVSIGESVVPNLSTALLDNVAKNRGAVPGTKTEYTGKAYDDISKCLDAIGNDNLRTQLSQVRFSNTRGRAVCSWARNPKLLDILTPEEALVADFFSYDSVGRVKASYRFTGVERDPTRKLISKVPEYDDLSNLVKVEIRDAGNNVLSARMFEYDEKGRTVKVKDENGNSLIKYVYNDFNKKSQVVIGDVAQVDYKNHLHGQITEIKVTNIRNNEVVYEQKLNYEKVDGGAMPRYDGRISQIKSSVRFADADVENDYAYYYDLMGNMVTKDGSGAKAWFNYDENGRLLAQQYALGHLAYNYAPGSYKVTDVSGKIALDSTRDASRRNNFIYDASGRVVSDSSKSMLMEYDMSGSMVRYSVDNGNGAWKAVNVYDQSGWRVGVLSFRNDTLLSVRTDLMIDGMKELERRLDVIHNTANEYRMTYGASGILGRVMPDGSREWYVKDYQGSLVMTFVNDAIGNVVSYEPFGSQKRLQVNGDVPAEQYTGMELDEVSGLYYFGARFFDPILAIWMTPDPARQYLNPYGYGGDPINAIDLYGLWKFGLGITIGWEHGGFTLGVGAACDVGTDRFGVSIDVGASHNFKDGSNTYSAAVGASINIGIVGIGANVGYSYNTISGSALNYGVRGSIYGAGIGVKGANYWDASGNYMGGTLGVETFYGAFGAEVYTGYEWGYSGMQGRGLYTGASAWGAHAEFTNIGTSKWGFDWGASVTTTYFVEKKEIDKDNVNKYKLSKKDQKWVGVEINGFEIVRYDHSNRNRNQPLGRDWKNKEEFIAYADANNMSYGTYGDEASAFHEPGVNEKMWMAEKGKEPVGTAWKVKYGESGFTAERGGLPSYIPSIEGVFNRRNGSNAGASYNYGNNYISHFAFDILPWLIMD